jgi:hypothetical protein
MTSLFVLFILLLDVINVDDEWSNNVNDDQLLRSPFEDVTEIDSPKAALELFRKGNIIQDKPQQRIFVSRLDGIDELEKEVIGVYKNPKTNLRVGVKVRFEEEDAVGSGPVREYLSIAMNILDEGVSSSGSKKILFFEGQKDHRVPVHNQSLRLTGMFKALGKMLRHSILHGGPGLHGVSPVVKCYMATDRSAAETQSLPLTLEDLPDLELRNMIATVINAPLLF